MSPYPLKLVRSYRKTATAPLPVPQIPVPPPDAAAHRISEPIPTSHLLPSASTPDYFSHTQTPLRQPHIDVKQRAAAQAEATFPAMDNLDPFSSLGDFLATLFHNRVHNHSGTVHE
ncbi:hypothetical protein B0H14DRAFT_2611902 [Mycena olivaceomarginata]|jgi:cell division septation protein DedD|nr:hypothetical protein B0H14DRAFT_2611902 [Mycena olivaceomarginata]